MSKSTRQIALESSIPCSDDARVLTLAVEGSNDEVFHFAVPEGWVIAKEASNNILVFFRRRALAIGVNAFAYDGHTWIHASISRPDGLPTYQDLCYLHKSVFGAEGYAAQVFAPYRFHVNIHPNCLHLWGPADPAQWPLPRFEEGTI